MALRLSFCWALLVCAVAWPTQAQTYRWKDERGITHYGDKVPPQYRDSAQVELSNGGIPVKSIEKALTPQQRAELEAKKAADAEAAKKREEFERIDRALMTKYANSAELAAAHRRDFERLDDDLKALTSRTQEIVRITNDSLARKPYVKSQRNDFGTASGELLQLADLLQRKLAEREDTSARHTQERDRFEKLLGNKK